MKHSKLSRIIISIMIKPCLVFTALTSLPMYAGDGGKLNIGLNLNYTNSNSGLGSDIKPGIGLYKNTNVLMMGINIQKRNLNVAGFWACFEHGFESATTSRAELFVFGSAAHHTSAFLSNRYVRLENYACREGEFNYTEMKLNLVELYGGFGLHIKLTPHLYATTAIGAGMYHTIEAPEASKNMIRENSAATVYLKCGIAWTLKRTASYIGH